MGERLDVLREIKKLDSAVKFPVPEVTAIIKVDREMADTIAHLVKLSGGDIRFVKGQSL